MTSPVQADSASAIIKQALADWGLSELFDDVDRLLREGLSEDAVNVALQQTEAYRQRFAANEDRLAKGLAVLSPAEYVAAEAAYRRVLQSYGLPEGFYDNPAEDFRRFLASDISPDELNSRARIAQEAFLSTDPTLRQAWREMYGLSDGAGIAAMLDESRALPILTRMATAATGGAAALRNQLEADRVRLERLADRGFTGEQLAAGFAEIGTVRSTDEAIARRFGTSFTQAEAEESRIEGLASARRKQAQLYQSEQALFDGRAASVAAANTRRTAGSF